MGYNAFQALGDMAKSGGSYYSVLAQEQLRSQRLAEARAAEESSYQRGRADKKADLVESRAFETAEEKRRRGEAVEDRDANNQAKLEHDLALNEAKTKYAKDNPKHENVIKGVNAAGEDVFYKQNSNGDLEETDVGVSYAGDSVGAEWKNKTSVRKELSGVIKDSGLEDIKVGLDKMVNAYKGENSMSDAAMIFYFMKTLDPDSVVRESEFQTVKDARAFMSENPETGERMPSWLKQTMQSWNGEGSLLPEQREQMLDESINAYNSTVSRADSVINSFRTNAERRGWNDNDIGLDRFKHSQVSRETLFPDKDKPVQGGGGRPAHIQAIIDKNNGTGG